MISETKCRCECCSKEFFRRTAEVNRNKKRGRRVYCGNGCSAKATYSEKLKYAKRNIDHLQPDNKSDEYTPFRWYILRAKQRKQHEFNLDLQYLKELWEEQSGICPITGWNMILRTLTDNRRKDTDDASLDRLDNSKGYVKGNVRFVSFIANMARNSFTDTELIRFCSDVADYQGMH